MSCPKCSCGASTHRDSDAPVVDEVSGVGWWPGFEEPEHPAITEAREELREAERRVERAQTLTRVARKKYIDTCVLASNARPNDRPGYSNVTGYA